jgi:hypothetical protein
LSASRPIIAVLATMNTKSKEAHFIASALERAGVAPLIVDLSMKPHDLPTADITGDQVARLAGTSWQALNGYARQEAAAVMVKGGIKFLHEKHTNGAIAGVIGIGGANGTNLVCSILRRIDSLEIEVKQSHRPDARPETGSVQFSYFVARRHVPSRLVRGGFFPRQLVGPTDQQLWRCLTSLLQRYASRPSRMRVNE